MEHVKKSWFKRNWLWFVPSAIVGAICLFALFIGVLFLSLSKVMKSSDVYKAALIKAKSNPEVVRMLGEPIEESWFFMGNISVSGNSGTANLDIPISGPNGSGKIHVDAEKFAGEWTYNKLAFKGGSASLIDLK